MCGYDSETRRLNFDTTENLSDFMRLKAGFHEKTQISNNYLIYQGSTYKKIPYTV